ncbi:hypothetical protein RRG08_059649 [Elysia crispata]|uniref:Uncharacterized protein n=1 Tax=Elysia crispata TaxID=231223 RepID=A0AAE1EB71_9GAST|nr:hypothetical protein RRG08_059649 [Elysia crispata]
MRTTRDIPSGDGITKRAWLKHHQSRVLLRYSVDDYEKREQGAKIRMMRDGGLREFDTRRRPEDQLVTSEPICSKNR